MPQLVKVPCTEQAGTSGTEQILFLRILLPLRKDDIYDFKFIVNIPVPASLCDVIETIGTSIGTSSQCSCK